MNLQSRRSFLSDVGDGMVVVGLGTALASEMGFSTALAAEQNDQLDFGSAESLVRLMQQTPVEKLQPQLVSKLKSGETTLDQLVAAASLANAESFGGQDYVGYHTEMALLPALRMAAEMPDDRRALPVLKVMHRNTSRIQESGKCNNSTLRAIASANLDQPLNAQTLRDAQRAGKMNKAEAIYAALSEQMPTQDAYNELLWLVQDGINVHRFVLAHRAFALIDVVGEQNAHTMLRQCVRFCVDEEINRLQRNRPVPEHRALLPRLIDQYKLLSKPLGDRLPDDAWVQETSNRIYQSSRDEAADVVAAALADGVKPSAIAEAISLAANQLVLRQDKKGQNGWRAHGDSPGVHASDAANAWRNMIRVSNDRNIVVGLLVSAIHTAAYRPYEQKPYPHDGHFGKIKSRDAASLLGVAEECIRANDQEGASAAIYTYGEQGCDPQAVFDLMRKYAVSEDGRLHAEKYYWTAVEEFAASRPAFRWRQLIGLARVTASSYGYDRFDNKGHRAPGYEQACRLLGVPT